MLTRRRETGSRRHVRTLAAVVLAAGLLPGCQHRPVRLDPAPPRPVWPPPPDPPRIEFVSSIFTPSDLGIRKNWFVRFVSWALKGRERAGMARPYALSVGPDGTIAVADPDAFSVHVYDVAGRRYRRLNEADGGPLLAPVGVAIDLERRIYVADSSRAAVFRYDAEGRWIDTLGRDRLLRPTGLAFDRDARVLYVVDTLAHRIVGFDKAGNVVVEFGQRGRGDGEFNYPVAIAVDRSGRLYVTDSLNFRIQVFDRTGRFLFAFGGSGTAPGRFDKAKGIALDADGHIYVVEGLHDVIQVFDAEGRLLTVVGTTGTGPGEFGLPAGIHIDRDNRILIADSANHRIQILRYLGAPGPAPGGGGS